MRQVAVFNEIMTRHSNGKAQVESGKLQSFLLNENSITCGLINAGDTNFDGALPENYDKVLVRKKAFSCNYRDKSLVVKAQLMIDSCAEKNQAKYYTVGSEFAAEVVAVGQEVQNLKVGDQVIGNGNYPFSDYEEAKPGLPTNHGSKELEIFHFSKLVKVPSSMSPEIAAGFPIGGQTVYSMIRKLELKAGEKVLVTAATSNTSLFAISALKHLPVKVSAITTKPDFVQELKELGADEVFVIERGLESIAQDDIIREYVRANGLYDAVIDPFFDIYLPQVIDAIGLEGRYVTCGLYGQPHVVKSEGQRPPINLQRVMMMAMLRNIKLMGNCIGKTSDLENAVADFAAGKLEVVIDSVFQNDNVSEFFDKSFNATKRFGKVVYKY